MKRTILILAGVFGLLLVAALTVPFFVPKSVYKAQIEKAATSALNRDVLLTGDVSVSVFPRISASIGGVTVANPDGFSAPNMIEAGELRGSVKWMPLLSRRVEVQELSFVDANVQLEKLADGRTNWDFGASSDAEPAASGDGGGVSASIGKASLKNASLTYTDRAAGTEYALTDLNLDASMQGFDKPLKASADGVFQDQAFDIDLTLDTPEQLQNGSPATVDAKFDSKLATGMFDGSVTLGDAPALDGTFSLDAPNLADVAAFASIELPVNIAPLGAGNMKGSVSGPFDALTIKFDNLDLKSDLLDLGFTGTVALQDSPTVDGQLQASASNTGELLSQMGIEVPAEDALEQVNIAGKVSGPADALSLTGLDIKHTGALLNASYKGEASLAGDGKLNGTIDASSDELRALLKAADVEMPDGDTLKTFSTAGAVSGSFKKLAISNLDFALDDIRATGTAGLDLSGTKPHLSGDLDMGELDLSPFLAAEDQQKKPQQPMEGWSKEPLDLAGLKAVDADLKIKTTTLTLGNVVLKDATVIATLRNGKLNADLPAFNAFGGSWGGKMSLDASAAKPAIALDMTGDSVGVSSLLGTLAGFDKLTGTGAFAVSATSTGTSIDEIMKDLNGQVSTKLNDGAIKGLNVAQLVRSKDSLLQAVTSGQLQGLDFASALSPEAKTDFSSFDTVLSVKNGVANVDLMKLISPVLGIDGTGNINLGGQTLDLRLATSIDKKGEGSGSVVQLNGIPVPIRLSGSWTKPKVTPDLSGVTNQLKQDLTGQLLEGLTGKSGSSGANPLADILGTSTSTSQPETPSTETETTEPAKQQTPEDLAEQAAKEALGNLLFGKKKTEDKPDE
ncbi:AsmA family protein [Hyphomonas adhaerens MHS-3]|uniref:AsmA family protein n=1 Tax=Hyphomonas adhaerens MHS-3 TaxID=1280949 RepID=A0A069E0K3_9PROT|nr:AsmA family protein [Hyphomonas adhaerens]KCZ82869.1 AsmA family protein [Hyphomonas adhaerens MHS-3]